MNRRPLLGPPAALASQGLSPPQMAFVRAWAEGLDLAWAWQRYMGKHQDGEGRQARRALRQLLDQLRSLARGRGRADLAALLSRDPEAMRESAGPAVSLDDFRAQQPVDFYTEAELAEMYQATHGRVDARSATRRRQRLRQRLVAALQWLDTEPQQPPQVDDPLAQWLDARVVQRLATVGLHRLGDLLRWQQQQGYHWHRPIPGLGPKGAARLLDWLQQHRATLGALPSRLLVPPRQLNTQALPAPPMCGIVPLERFAPPPALAGAPALPLGDGDGDRNDDATRSDLAAVNDWLQTVQAQPHTWRAYRREAERLMLWAVLCRRRALGSLDTDDAAAYLAFLQQPAPGWTAPRHTQRQAAAWRPFEGPLAPHSVRTAQAILRTLFAWLQRAGQVRHNPWASARRQRGAPAPAERAGTTPAVAAARRPAGAAAPTAPHDATAGPYVLVQVLDDGPRRQLQRWLASQPSTPALRRQQLLVALAGELGLRMSELAAARLSWLAPTPDSALPHPPAGTITGLPSWQLNVPALVGPARTLALPAAVMPALMAHLADRQLAGPLVAAPQPLLGALRPPASQPALAAAPLSEARLHAVLAQVCRRCALALQAAHPEQAALIRQASARSLRQGWGVQAARQGASPGELQLLLGHQRQASSRPYRRSAAVEPA